MPKETIIYFITVIIIFFYSFYDWNDNISLEIFLKIVYLLWKYMLRNIFVPWSRTGWDSRSWLSWPVKCRRCGAVEYRRCGRTLKPSDTGEPVWTFHIPCLQPPPPQDESSPAPLSCLGTGRWGGSSAPSLTWKACWSSASGWNRGNGEGQDGSLWSPACRDPRSPCASYAQILPGAPLCLLSTLRCWSCIWHHSPLEAPDPQIQTSSWIFPHVIPACWIWVRTSLSWFWISGSARRKSRTPCVQYCPSGCSHAGGKTPRPAGLDIEDCPSPSSVSSLAHGTFLMLV